MAGGNFTAQNKLRPGVYTRVQAQSQQTQLIGARGIVAMAMPMDWGVENEFIRLSTNNVYDGTLARITGYDGLNEKNKVISASLENANTLLLYRLNAGGAKATVSLTGDIVVTAKYTGIVGNTISVGVVEVGDTFVITTYVGSISVNVQTVTELSQIVNNDYVDFDVSGATEIQPTVPTLLVGGTNGEFDTVAYQNFLNALEAQEFTTLASVNYGEEAIFTGANIKAFIERMREIKGIRVQAVINNYNEANYEGIISSLNQGVERGSTLPALQPEEFVAWLAGATAGADIFQSITYKIVQNATKIINPVNEADVEELLGQGYMLLTTRRDNQIVVEKDINTLTTFTPEKNFQFSYNKTIRLLDDIVNQVARDFEDNYIGKVNNDVNGQNLFKTAITARMTELQTAGGIQNFNSSTDIFVSAGEQPDAFYAEIYVQPTYSVEKLYLVVNVG